MSDVSVSLPTLIAVVGGLLSFGAAGYAVLLRFSFDTYQKSTEKRFTDLENAAGEDERELKQQVDRLTHQNHELEKTTIRLEGDVKVLETSHERSSADLAGRMERIESGMAEILKELRASAGRYGGSTPRFPVTSIEPKKDERR